MKLEKVSVVIPVYFRTDLVKVCIKTLIETNPSVPGYNVEFVVVDNKSDDRLRDYLRKLPKKDPRFKVLLLNKNQGKAKAVMLALEKYPVGEFFINLDSDILSLTDNWIHILLDSFKCIVGAGMVSVNYTKNGNNPMPLQPRRRKVKLAEREYTYHYGGAVAGGCFVTSKRIWKAIGGYKRSLGVYGGVDGLFRQTVHDILHLKCGYLEEVMVEHPNDRDTKYFAWKIGIQRKIIANSPLAKPEVLGNEKGFFDK